MDALDYDSMRLEIMTGRYDTISTLINKDATSN